MDNGTDVWVLGGYQSDFARNLRREGLDFADLRAFGPNAQEINVIDLKTGTSWPIAPDADPSMTVQLQGATAMLFAHTSRPDLSKSPRYRSEEVLDVTRPQP